MKQSELYAQYWIAMATTGTVRNRDLRKMISPGYWIPISDEEKVNDALNTARNHIQNYTERYEKMIELIHTKENSNEV